jgi:hypothetical protein
VALAVGVLVGAVVSAASNAVFPDPPLPAAAADIAAAPDRDSARWIALRGTLIVMPVFVLALTDPVVLPGGDHEDGGTRPAGRRNPCPHGRARADRIDVDGGADGPGRVARLVLWPSLWMLVLWLMAAALWAGSALFAARPTRWRPSFWSNALITALILFGPAIEDSASGKSVLEGGVMRVSLFIGVALYAWATVWALERWRAGRPQRRPPNSCRRRSHDLPEPPGRAAGDAAVPRCAGCLSLLERAVLRAELDGELAWAGLPGRHSPAGRCHAGDDVRNLVQIAALGRAVPVARRIRAGPTTRCTTRR